MDFHGKTDSLIAAVPHAKSCKHIAFSSDADAGSPSLFSFLPYVHPKVSLNPFKLIGFRICIDLTKYGIYLFELEIDNVVHHALCKADMLFVKFEIEYCFFRERFLYIAEKIDCKEPAAVIRTERNFPA